MNLYYPLTVSEARELIEAGADVNERDDFGETPLHSRRDEGFVKLLIESGADVTIKNIYLNTPLHFQDNEGVVRLLIKAGADVNARNIYGNTPLHYRRDEGVVRLLIEFGADVNARDEEGMTPIEYFSVVKRVVETMASEKITRFIRNCKWLRLYKLTRTFAFNKWYCGEEDGNGGGTGRKVDHKRIMDTFVM